MRQISLELSSIDTTITVNESAFALSLVTYKLTHIRFSIDFIDQMPIPFFISVRPLSLIVLLISVEHSIAMFLISLPLSIIVSSSLIVIVYSLTFLGSFAQMAIVYLSTMESVDSLPVKNTIFPSTEVYISYWILQYSFAMSLSVFVELSDIYTLVILYLLSIRKFLYS